METRIGEAAGQVWQTLRKNPMAPTQLLKATGLPSNLANQAIGWLAREGKVASETTPKGTILKLKA